MARIRKLLVPAAAALLAGAALVLGGPAAGAADAPTLTVTPATGLDPGGATITVSGSGFKASGMGIYLGVTSHDLHSTTDASVYSATHWVAPAGTRGATQTINADGTFSFTIDVRAAFGAGDKAVDCLTTRCAVYTFAAHGSSDRSQDTSADIAFAGAAPIVSVTPTTGLAVDGTEVTVTGTGFDTAQAIYLGFTRSDLYSAVNAAAYTGAQRIAKTGSKTFDAAGNFTTTMTLRSSFTVQDDAGNDVAVDCLSSSCSVFVWPASHRPDAVAIAAIPVTFAGAPNPGSGAPSTPAPSTSAAAAQGTLSKSTVAPGGSTVVTATGFAPEENVQAVLHSEPVDLGISRAAADGSFRLEFTVAASVPVGAHTLTLTGLTSGRVVNVALTVQAAPAATQPLAATGANTTGLLVVGTALLLGGGVLLIALRRRPAGVRAH